MPDNEKYIEYYKIMLKIRYFEELIEFLFSRGKIHGTAHFCIGQEACAVGVCASLRKEDYVTSNHRGHGHAIAKGLDITKLVSELQGKSLGYCSGKGGTQHIIDPDNNFIANGITAGMIPVATGIALSFLLKKKDNVVICFFGDGAANEGNFHEALNLASIWNLPIVFVCENNLYAMSTSVKDAMRINDISHRAASYGMPGVTVDGQDILKVKRVAEKAVMRAREKKGPTLIECKTYRYRGHSKNDPRKYRTKEEEEKWLKRDPIALFKSYLIKSDALDKAKDEKIKETVKLEIEKAQRAAGECEVLTADKLYDHVYASD